MKAKHLLIAVLIIVNCQLIIDDCFGQNIGINTTGNPANSSAGLDVDFTNKGFLLPRMTTAQRNAIVSPALGLQIINTTTNCLEIYFGTTWQSIYCGCTPPSASTANAASSIAQTSFTANWTTSAGATAYYLDVNTNSAFTGTWILNNVNVGNVTSYSVTGLTCATTYYYRVRANNSCGTSANSNIITQATSSCACVPSTPVTFNYTGSSTTWTVPGGVFCITVDVKGAQGGTSANPSGGNGTGGLGGRVQGTIAVTPFEVLTIYVGGAGSLSPDPGMGGAGYNGGGNGAAGYSSGWIGSGGGGASDIRRTPYALGNRLAVGAGGGGGGSNGSTPNANFGGIGGGLTGGTGGSVTGVGQGGGGSQVGGGTEMDYGGYCAESGSRVGTLGNGGPGCNVSAGGGGGGGYYGGGGGEFGGGGGGSGYADPAATGVTHTSGFQSGNGQVIITY